MGRGESGTTPIFASGPPGNLQFGLFTGTVLLQAFGLIAAAAGLAATWPRDRATRWTPLFLTGVSGLVLGALAAGPRGRERHHTRRRP